jgi:hypothetical protein
LAKPTKQEINMKMFITRLLILTLLMPAHYAQAQTVPRAPGINKPFVAPTGDEDLIMKRILAFIDAYQTKAIDSTSVEPIPTAATVSEKLIQWEKEALAKALNQPTSAKLLDIARGTSEDRELQREARKIVYDIFSFWGGDSAAEFRQRLQDEIWIKYVTDRNSREPIEMLVGIMAGEIFTAEHKTNIEKNRHVLGNTGWGTLAVFVAAGAYFLKVSPGRRAEILNKMTSQKTRMGKSAAKYIETVINKLGLGKKPGKSLVVVPDRRAEEFRRKYGRNPIGESELMTPAQAANVPKERLRLRRLEKVPESEIAKIARINPIGAYAQRGSRAVYSAMSKAKGKILTEYLNLSPVQQVMAMGRFMGLSVLGGTALSGLAAARYNLPDSQFTVIPQDELAKFIRPVAVLDLTCRAEKMVLDLDKENFAQNGQDKLLKNADTLKGLIDDYRFLLGVASMYTNTPEESLPLPREIEHDVNAGTIIYANSHEGEDFEIPVDCPARQGKKFQVISLIEGRRVLEKIRDRLLATEVELSTEQLNVEQAENLAAAQAAPALAQIEDTSKEIAVQIMNMTSGAHNQMVTGLVAQAVAGDANSKRVVEELAALMEKLESDPEQAEALKNRMNPSEVLKRQESENGRLGRVQNAAQEILNLPRNAHNRAIVALARKALKNDKAATDTLFELDKLMEKADPLVIDLGGRLTPDEAMKEALTFEEKK